MSAWKSFRGKARRTRFAFRPLLEVMEDRTLLSFITGASYPVGLGPQGVAVGDFNGDGHLDLAVANYSADTVSILLGNGDGTFQPAQSYAAGFGATDVAVGDFNGDGIQDLALTSGSNTSTVSILLGNGDGTFQAARSYAAGSGPIAVAVGDFNRDGIPDLAVANREGGSVSILLGNGDGTFQAPRTFQAGFNPYHVIAADFNGDGMLDLAVVVPPYPFQDAVNVFLGNGDGTFRFAQSYAAKFGSLAVGDFNGDGRLDLVTSGGSLLLGNGDGTFQSALTFVPGGGSVAAGDFDGDGHLDLTVANSGTSPHYTDGSLSVLLGKGDGSFQDAQSYLRDSQPGFVAVGDFNGDGWPDLAVSNGRFLDFGIQGTLTILLNAADWFPATSFQVAAPAGVSAGSSFDVTVSASDQYGHPVRGYTGTVTFSSSDSYPGLLPADYTFLPGDNGTHTFTGVTLFTAGMQRLTAQDKADGSVTGSKMIAVGAAPADHFLITAGPTAVSGTAFDVTLTAVDFYGNVDTNYSGTTAWASSDSDPGVVLPALYTFQATDNGMHTFAAGVTLLTPGDQTLTATDTANGTLTGSAIVTVAPPPAPPPGGGANEPLSPTLSTPVQSGQQVVLLDRLFAFKQKRGRIYFS